MTVTRGARLALFLILLTRLALGAAYSLVVPVWEAYDEDGHFAYVRYLAKYRQLLDPADPEAQAVYEKFQPPLYYILVAPFLAGFDLGAAQPRPERNPLFTNGNAGLNYALHPPQLNDAEANLVLAVRIARLAGVLISTLSVLFVFAMARCVWPRQPGPVWAATLLYAFWPQFLFNGSMVTNDLAVTAFSAGVLAVAVWLVVDGFRAGRALALALLFGAAVLSKINALSLLPVVVLATAMSLTPALRQARWRSPLPWLVVLALLGVVAGALAVLNSFDFVTEQVLQASTLQRFWRNLLSDPAARRVAATATAYGFRTFFASFGWGNVETWPWLYDVWTLAFGGGVVGLGAGLVRRSGVDGRVLLLMSLQAFGLLAVALALSIALSTRDLAPGRYLLPALPAVIGLLVEGWRVLLAGLLTRRVQGAAWKAAGIGMVLLGWALPIMSILPAYRAPQPLEGPVDVPAKYSFGEAIELIGHQSPRAVRPGETVALQVCWQAAQPVTKNYTVFVEAVGPDGQGYGRLLTYPGRGNYATSFWAVGQPFCDSYELVIEPAMPAPAQAWVRVALLRAPDVNAERLPVVGASGERVDLDVYSLPFKIAPPANAPAPAQPLDYRFGDALVLRGYSLRLEPAARQVSVSLQWEAMGNLQEDYIVFVHLRDTPTSAYAQADTPPRGGWYPTPLWQTGEVIEDVHTLTLPAGREPPLSLVVGVVNSSQAARLPAYDGEGRRLPDDELVLVRDWILGDGWAMPDSLDPAGAP